jgi:hypothetical protein
MIKNHRKKVEHFIALAIGFSESPFGECVQYSKNNQEQHDPTCS